MLRRAGRAQEAPLEPATTAISETKPASQTKLSYLQRLWELDKESRPGRFSISPHRSIYILPITYVESLNDQQVRTADPGKELEHGGGFSAQASRRSYRSHLWTKYGSIGLLTRSDLSGNFIITHTLHLFRQNKLRTGDSFELSGLTMSCFG